MSKLSKLTFIIVAIVLIGTSVFFFFAKKPAEPKLEKTQVSAENEKYIELDLKEQGFKISYPQSFQLEKSVGQSDGYTVAAVLSGPESPSGKEKFSIVYYDAPKDSSITAKDVLEEAASDYAKNSNIKIKEKGEIDISDQKAEYIVYELANGEVNMLTKEVFIVSGGRIFNLVSTANTDVYDKEAGSVDKMFASFTLTETKPKAGGNKPRDTAPKKTDQILPAPKSQNTPADKTVAPEKISYALETSYYTPKRMNIRFLPISGWKIEESTSTESTFGQIEEVTMYDPKDGEPEKSKKSFSIQNIPRYNDYDKLIEAGYSPDDFANILIKANENDLNYYKVIKFNKITIGGKKFYYVDASYVRDNGEPGRTTDYFLFSLENSYLLSIFAEKSIESSVYPILEKVINNITFS